MGSGREERKKEWVVEKKGVGVDFDLWMGVEVDLGLWMGVEVGVELVGWEGERNRKWKGRRRAWERPIWESAGEWPICA